MVMSEMSVRLLPAVWPNVEIHTSRFEVAAALGTEMVLLPGLSGVGPVSTVVSARLAGLAVEALLIWTWVPVLDTVMVTLPTTVDSGNCSMRPTPFLKFGNGTVSV